MAQPNASPSRGNVSYKFNYLFPCCSSCMSHLTISSDLHWLANSHLNSLLSTFSNPINIKMKLFETALENFWVLGLEWHEDSQKFVYNINKTIIAKGAHFVSFTCTLCFLIKDAKSFDEYTEALFVCSTSAMCIVITICIYIKLGVLAEYIKSARAAVSESK